VPGAVQAIAAALQRDPVAQLVATRERRVQVARRHRRRAVMAAGRRLARAHRVDDQGAVVAAIVELLDLGVHADQLRLAAQLAIELDALPENP
jgi:hypothetical protein